MNNKNMFGRIKKIFLQKKALIVILIALVIVGWIFAIYFGIKMNQARQMTSENCAKRIEKVNAYSDLLDKSNKLVRQKRGLEVLETDVRVLNNGTLLSVWQNVVLGGNRERDLNDYFDTLLDSIMFFSE